MRIDCFDIASPTTTTYRIRLAVPIQETPPTDGWPVLTILGHDAFDAACALMRYHADCQPPGYLDAGVLVGVGYAGENQRKFDYTPSRGPAHDPAIAQAPQGGADAFLHFLLHTLRPTLHARLPLHPMRQALAGHSLGGLFTLHTLFTHPDAFQTYIASSPSVWWGDQYLEREAQTWVDQASAMASRLAVEISVGEYEQTVSPLEQTRPDAQRLARVRQQRGMMDGSRRVAQTLARAASLRVGFHVYPGQYHRSVWPCALNLGLLTALRKG